MTSFMRTTARRGAVVLGAVALTAGMSACGLIPSGGDDGGEDGASESSEDGAAEEPSSDDGAAAEEETEAEGATDEGSEGADSADSEDAEEPADDASEEGADSEDAEGSDDAASGEITAEDESAAKQQVIGFMHGLGDGDAEAACGYVMDPSTGTAIAGDQLSACADALESSGQMDSFTPEIADLITEDMLEATDNGDGTLEVGVAGQEGSTFSMSKGTDGQWYLDVL